MGSSMEEEAALLAATVNHKYQPAGLEGINTSVPQYVLDSQFESPRTGIVYTPPSYSDHVGVCAWMRECVPNLSLEKDTPTKKAQPHKLQRCISSFFKKASPNMKRKRHESN